MPSLSRLKDKGTGEGKTRGDHASDDESIVLSLCTRETSKEIAVILENQLSDVDKIYAALPNVLKKNMSIKDSIQTRSIEETLDLGWELLSMLPRTELKRIKEDMLDQY